MKILRILFASFFVFHISLGSQDLTPSLGSQDLTPSLEPRYETPADLPYEVQCVLLRYLSYGQVCRLCNANPEDKNVNGTERLRVVRHAHQCCKNMYALPPLQHSVSSKIKTDTLKNCFLTASPKTRNDQYQKIQMAWEFIHSFNTNQTIPINILDRYKKNPNPKEAFLNDIDKKSTRKKGAVFAKNTGDKQYYLVLRTKTKTLDDQSTKRQIDLDLQNMPPDYSLVKMDKRLKDFSDVPAAIKTDNTEFLSALLGWDLKTISPLCQSSYRAPTDPNVLALLQLMKPVVEFDFRKVNTQMADGNRIDITDSFLEKMIEILKVKYPDIQAVKFKGALYGPQNAEEILEIMTPSTMEDPIQFKWTSTNPLKKKDDLQHFPKTIASLPPQAHAKFKKQYSSYCFIKGQLIAAEYTPDQWIEKWKNWDFWTKTHKCIANAYGIKDDQVGKKRNQANAESGSENPLRKAQKTSR